MTENTSFWLALSSIATCLLAGATVVMAYSILKQTRRMGEALRMAHRPILASLSAQGFLPMPSCLPNNPYTATLHNVGRGEAILLRITVKEDEGRATQDLGRHLVAVGKEWRLPNLNVLRCEAVARAYQAVIDDHMSGRRQLRRTLSVHLTYADDFGNQYCQDFDESSASWLQPQKCKLARRQRDPVMLIARPALLVVKSAATCVYWVFRILGRTLWGRETGGGPPAPPPIPDTRERED